MTTIQRPPIRLSTPLTSSGDRSVRSSIESQREICSKSGKPLPYWPAAEMFAQDIAYGRATRLCQCCQLPFVSSAYQARYCSPNCRQLQQKRNVRKQAKEARSLRAQGQTIRQIASALGQDLHIVKGWLAKA